MEPSDLLLHIAEVLERLGVRYLVTGSIALTSWTGPRGWAWRLFGKRSLIVFRRVSTVMPAAA